MQERVLATHLQTIMFIFMLERLKDVMTTKKLTTEEK